MRVIFVGGTSHAGKSTLGQSLAASLGGQYRSTDKMARHPGRPWRTPPDTVPPHVTEHFLSLPVDELIVDVVRHYTENVWPQVEQIIAAQTTDAESNGPVVIEGSALLPELAARVLSPNVAGVWLTASGDFLTQTIHRESDYQNKSPRERQTIDKFVERTLRFNERVLETVHRLGLNLVDVEQMPDSDGRLLTLCRRICAVK